MREVLGSKYYLKKEQLVLLASDYEIGIGLKFGLLHGAKLKVAGIRRARKRAISPGDY